MFWGSLWMILVDKLVFFCFLRNHNESKVFLLVCVVCQPITGIEFDSYSKQYTGGPGWGGGGEELVLEVLPVESRQSIEKIAILTLPYLYFYNHILTFCFDC